MLLNQARYNGVAGLIDMPGVPAINLVLGLYNYAPSKKVVAEATALQTKAIEAQGAQGRQLLNDIDTYLAGINARMQVAQPTSPPFTRTDIYALNAIKSQFLGEGGGQEVDNALFLDGLRSKLGAKTGDKAFADLRARNDVEASVTTSKSFPGQGSVSVSKPSGMVRLKNGTFKNSFIKLPGASAASASAASAGKRQLASNILIVSGAKSATGKPLFVGGPQIGFNYPGLTMEMQLSSPSINVEGVTSAPFPGYMLIGHGADYAWSLTSAGADIIDTYAEKLCGGSKTKYSYKGKCRAMEKVQAGTITKVGSERQDHRGLLPHGPRPGHRLRQGREDGQAGRAVAQALLLRARDGRPAVQPADDVRARAQRARLRQRRQEDAADVQLVLRERDGVGVLHLGRVPGPAQGRQRRPAGRRQRQVRVEGRAGVVQAPAGGQPGQRLHRQLEQQAGRELPGR